MKKIVIAIDGHSSTGKSTVAKAIAKQLGYIYIDSGAMYRAVTLFALRNGLIENSKIDKNTLIQRLHEIGITFRPNGDKQETYLNNENIEREIRSLYVSQNVSPIATIKEVREYLVDIQQKMGEAKGIVMDGRDIGTVVFPNAELKVFMTASAEIRAQRRYDELIEKGDNVVFDDILQNVIERDRIDENRKESPLRQAEDALLLDNGNLTREQQLEWILTKTQQLINQ